MIMSTSCAAFIAAYKSSYINCFTCRYWDHEELTCINPEEIARRRGDRELEEIEKLLRKNKPVRGPL